MIKENSIVQVISGAEIAFIGCCVQVEKLENGKVFGIIAYPLDSGKNAELIEVELDVTDVKFVGDSHVKPN